MTNQLPSNPAPFVCRDCGASITIPWSFAPEYSRRVVDVASSADGESVWDRETRHLCVTDADEWGPSPTFAQCRVGKGHPLTGHRLTLAMIQREIPAAGER